VIEKKISDRGYLFVEYVGDFLQHASPIQLLNSGAAYLITPTPQSTSTSPLILTGILLHIFLALDIHSGLIVCSEPRPRLRQKIFPVEHEGR
jgi:hypothetical protein